jgi:hypothetical protein
MWPESFVPKRQRRKTTDTTPSRPKLFTPVMYRAIAIYRTGAALGAKPDIGGQPFGFRLSARFSEPTDRTTPSMEIAAD